ncbi:hypothetical protein [Arthrobacter cavernae]|uniref:Uncharacterized protein n=1 Tax=Arthrobacter cavernae TaxID=2817681 RepID=A0A939HA15_9MICC|nr:hypothetical protein [Arthrobacter cavernae]MBO1267062.1 hypothetical protein [Arthrobacter cavernae]
MAYVSKRVSDLTGVEASDDKFVELVVRSAPGLKHPVKLDVLPEEIKGLKSAGEIVVLEVKNGETEQLIVSLAEWKKLSPKIDEIVANAPGLKGRRPGFRPGS